MKLLPDKLHWSVWALSRPMSEQIDCFPAEVPAAEELGLEFEEHYEPSLAAQGDKWNDMQVESLRALDEQIATMSGSGQSHLWLDADALTRPEWAAVRDLANRVLEAFDFLANKPTRNPAIYLTE